MSHRSGGGAADVVLDTDGGGSANAQGQDVKGSGLFNGALGKLGILSQSLGSTMAESAVLASTIADSAVFRRPGAEPSPTSRASVHSELTLDGSSDTAGCQQTLELDSPGCSTSSFCGFPGFLGGSSSRPSRREGIRSMPASLHVDGREANIRSKPSTSSSKHWDSKRRQSGEAEPAEDSVPSPSSTAPESGLRTPEHTRFATATAQLDQQQCGQPVIVNLGPREPLSSLTSEFKHNARFGEKVRCLEGLGYDGWRRVRGDGNCYYRAVGMGLLELTVLSREPRSGEWTDALLEQLRTVKLEDAALRTAHEELLELLTSLREHVGDRNEAEQRVRRVLNDRGRTADLALIRALRCLTAEFMLQNRQTDFAGGPTFDDLCVLLELGSLEDFLNKAVLALGVEAQDVVLQAMPLALGIWVRVAFIDRIGAPEGAPNVPLQDFGPSLVNGEVPSPACELPLVHLQLRPGHYDLLYCGGH